MNTHFLGFALFAGYQSKYVTHSSHGLQMGYPNSIRMVFLNGLQIVSECSPIGLRRVLWAKERNRKNSNYLFWLASFINTKLKQISSGILRALASLSL